MMAEPPPSQGDLHFQVFGIPVRVHPWFWIVALIMGMQLKEPMVVLLWVACVFISILIHELGHAVAAKANGWQPHIVLYSFGGLAIYRPTRHDPRSQMIISLAGPMAGFFFIAFILAAVQASGHAVTLLPHGWERPWLEIEPFGSLYLYIAIDFLFWINVFWGLMNLLPVYPLDGGQIARELFLLNAKPAYGVRQSLMLSFMTAIGIAVAAFLVFDQKYLGFLFGYLAYTNYKTLQSYGGGFGGPRRW